MCMIAFICYVLVVAPFEIAFVSDSRRMRIDGLWVTNLLVDISFFWDMVLTFNTAYFDHLAHGWVYDRRKIAFNYLRLWFILDLVAIFPFDYLNPARARVSVDPRRGGRCRRAGQLGLGLAPHRARHQVPQAPAGRQELPAVGAHGEARRRAHQVADRHQVRLLPPLLHPLVRLLTETGDGLHAQGAHDGPAGVAHVGHARRGAGTLGPALSARAEEDTAPYTTGPSGASTCRPASGRSRP